jgi:hypothetical protein
MHDYLNTNEMLALTVINFIEDQVVGYQLMLVGVGASTSDF